VGASEQLYGQLNELLKRPLKGRKKWISRCRTLTLAKTTPKRKVCIYCASTSPCSRIDYGDHMGGLDHLLHVNPKIDATTAIEPAGHW